MALDHPMRGCHCAAHEKARTYNRDYYRSTRSRPVKRYVRRGWPKPDHPRRGCYCADHQTIRQYERDLINEKMQAAAASKRAWITALEREVALRIRDGGAISAVRTSLSKPKVRLPREPLSSLKVPGDTLRNRIEQAIARGLNNAEVMRQTACSYEAVHATRLRMDTLIAKAS